MGRCRTMQWQIGLSFGDRHQPRDWLAAARHFVRFTSFDGMQYFAAAVTEVAMGNAGRHASTVARVARLPTSRTLTTRFVAESHSPNSEVCEPKRNSTTSPHIGHSAQPPRACPPATCRTWPVIQLAWRDARKTHASAMSSGVPTRPSGIASSTSSMSSSAIHPVWIGPGATALTLTPCLRGPTPHRVSALRAPLSTNRSQPVRETRVQSASRAQRSRDPDRHQDSHNALRC